MSNFLDLQNGWYNGFLQGMGQSEDSFQILQPSPPIVELKGDTTVWNYFNNLPTKSLTGGLAASPGAQFYNNFRGLMSALEPTRDIDFEAVISPYYPEWHKYISSFPPPLPAFNTLPTLFRQWAMYNAPEVANKGASALAAMILDPVLAAQNELTQVYTEFDGSAKPFNWQFGYADVIAQLEKAPSRSFTFSSKTMNSNVKSSWTGGSNSGFFGLWGGSASTSSLSKKFASSEITVAASFDHVMTFLNTPGNWYSSSATSLAWSNKTGNPWSPHSSINWENTFGSPNGNMQRFMVNLIVASGMTVQVTSSAKYSTLEQSEIKVNGRAGFWPFFSASAGHQSSNTATFSQEGTMTIEITSETGVPVVLGGNVLDAAEFTGHSAESANIMRTVAGSY